MIDKSKYKNVKQYDCVPQSDGNNSRFSFVVEQDDYGIVIDVRMIAYDSVNDIEYRGIKLPVYITDRYDLDGQNQVAHCLNLAGLKTAIRQAKMDGYDFAYIPWYAILAPASENANLENIKVSEFKAGKFGSVVEKYVIDQTKTTKPSNTVVERIAKKLGFNPWKK